MKTTRNQCSSAARMILALLPVLLSATETFAGDTQHQWAARIGGANTDRTNAVAVSAANDVYLAGYVNGPADVNGDGDSGDGGVEGIDYGVYDAIISKFNSAGVWQWAKRLGGTLADSVNGAALDADGDLYVIGHTRGDADLNSDGDSGDGGAESSAGFGSQDIFVVKYSSTGVFAWAKRLGGAVSDNGNGIAASADGGIYVTGSVWGNADLNGDGDATDIGESAAGYASTDIFVTKFDQSGVSQWTKRFGGLSDDLGKSIAVDSSNNIVITGYVSAQTDLTGDADTDDGSAETGGDGMYELFVSKYNSSGAFQWAKRVSSSFITVGNGCAVDANGNVYVAGHSSSDADLNSDGDMLDSGETGVASQDLLLIKYTSAGSVVWARRAGSTAYNGGNALAADDYGNVYMTGSATGAIDLNGDGDTTDGQEGTDFGGTDIIAAAYSSDGSLAWAKRLGGGESEQGKAVAVSSSGHVVIGGILLATADLNADGDQTDGIVETGAGYANDDAFAARYLNLFSISGTVLRDAAPVAGVSIAEPGLGTATTDAQGRYSFSAAPQGTTYTITPAKTDYTFSPTSRSGTLTTEVTADFSATYHRFTLSGTITRGGAGLAGVTVNGGALGTTTTDVNGNFSFSEILEGTSYSITVSNGTYTFITTGAASGTLSANLDLDFAVQDSDLDGVTDSQEALDGTDPLDRGSALRVLNTTLCSEWNGFFNGAMWNIMEHVNLHSSSVAVNSTLYSIEGNPQSSRSFSILSGAQQDLLVHDMTGWTTQSYGKVCSFAAGTQAGDLDGRMVYYKPSSTIGRTYEFAFAMPFQNGVSGMQVVPFNTYQPSQDWVDASDLVTNWIQLTNLESSPQTGSLMFYGQDGLQLGSTVPVSLAAGARQDFSGHQFGPSLVGTIEWRPDSPTAHFQMRNVRYMYDNPGTADTFATAFQLEGMVPTVQTTAVPLNTAGATAVVEVGNASSDPQTAYVTIYDSSGTQLGAPIPVPLAAHGSKHIIADTVLNGSAGVAVITPQSGKDTIAVAMQYGRTTNGLGLQYMYGIPAQQALGTVLRGSYNTFLGQGCRLVLVNPGASAQSANISMQRYDGTHPYAGESVSVPAHGLLDYDLCGRDQTNVYGVATVQPQTPNSLIANVIRYGVNDEYRFPTPVRQ